MILGLDFLGIANKHVDLDALARAFPDGGALGVFAQAFGDALPVVEEFIRKLKKRGKTLGALRVQLWWDDDHFIAPMKFLEKEAPRWEAFAKRNPTIKVYISHSCEYQHSKTKSQLIPLSDVLPRVDLIARLCPSCKLVQSPGRFLGKQAPYAKGIGLLEEHGTKAKPGTPVVSADGICSADINTPKWLERHAGAELVFLHAPRFNLQHHVKPPNKLPPRLKRKAAPSYEYIMHILRQAVPLPDYSKAKFAGDPKLTRLRKPLLWKTVAEDTNPGAELKDPRGTKPMFFTRRKRKGKPEPFLEIVAANGQVLGRLMLFKDKNGKRTTERYYAGSPGGINLHGRQIEDLAIMTAGSPFVYLRQNKRRMYGPIMPSLRVPFYQKQK